MDDKKTTETIKEDQKKDDVLTDAELDKVSGGMHRELNPQPLPP